MGYLGVCPKQNPPPRPLLPPPPPRRKLRRRPASRSPAEEGAVWEGLKGWAFCSSVPETFSLSHFLAFGDGLHGKDHADESRTKELRCGGWSEEE